MSTASELHRTVAHDSFPKGETIVWRPMPGSQEAFLASTPIFEVLFEGTRGGGKAIADDTDVLTDKGWIKADQVNMNHQLVAGDGSYTTITGIYPQPLKKMFKVTFSDGQSIIACEDHNWTVMSNKNVERGWTVRKTKELSDNQWSVPFMEQAHGGKKWTGYDPYVLGLIAGDGTISSARDYITIYSVDEEILNYPNEDWKISRNESWSTSRASANLETSREIIEQLDRRSKIAIGILEADAESRLAYLQGLMDTDGTADRYEGKPSFCNNDEKLAKLVHDLCWSLGGKATINLKKYSGDRDKWCYQVAIAHQNKFNPFRLKRKADLVIVQKKHLKRCIKSVIEVESVLSRCFAVVHESHTFVIEGYVVTHNTDTLLMSFCMFVGRGFGAAWRGILFRQTYKQLEDVISKTKKWIPQIWPEAKFNNSEHVWTWPSGERLLLRQYAKDDDYWNYHGHEYPWIGWEELCNWASDGGYKRMFSCCRSSEKGMPRMVRATTNPYGPGHNWVKARWKLPAFNMRVIKDSIDEQGNVEPARLSIRSHIDENKALLEADPDYKQKIAASARNAAERKAWLEGSWDIVAGGMFDDVWDPKYNVIAPFVIPDRWRMTRSFDWGSSAPFSVGWWAISNGEDVQLKDGSWRSTIRGDTFRVHEWYGWTGKPNEGQRILATEITVGIIQQELQRGWRETSAPFSVGWWAISNGEDVQLKDGSWRSTIRGDTFRVHEWYGWTGKPNEGQRILATEITVGIIQQELQRGWRESHSDWCRVHSGIADSQIFSTENGNCIAVDMKVKQRLDDGYKYPGVTWQEADKRSGSRNGGWEMMRKMLKQAWPTIVLTPQGEERLYPRERPGLFIFSNCEHFSRTVPVLPRDEKDPDDVNTDAEDHVADETRYLIRSLGLSGSSGKTIGTN